VLRYDCSSPNQEEAAMALTSGRGNVQINTGILHQNSIFDFTIKSFQILDTRSVHKDTDFVSISVVVSNKNSITLPTKSMGDLNNGTYNVNLSIPNVEVGPNDIVTFAYAIVNAGHKQDEVEQKLGTALQSAAEKALDLGAAAVGTAIAGSIGGELLSLIAQAGGAWLTGQILGIIFADCDGPVAGGSHVYSGAQLAHQTANGAVISTTDDNPGTNSPVGCGGNSHYKVSWSISGRPETLTAHPVATA
jgi:hypothetical protein